VKPRFVVYTDLDGTLLDHHTYEWAAAAPMLAKLERLAVPVVIVTSKTREEVNALRAALANPHPYIVENGVVTLVPDGYFGSHGRLRPVDAAHPVSAEVCGPGRQQIDALVSSLREQHGYRFQSFAELGTDGIVEHTGLSPAAARLANTREGSEPLLWQDTQEALDRFRSEVQAHGLECVRGGRFVHVMGPTDKAAAVQALHRRFEHTAGRALDRIVLGDGPNDLAMLAQADVAVVVRGMHEHAMALPADTQVLRTAQYGPAGWAWAMERVLAARGLADEDAAPTPGQDDDNRS
jgi:mannosyl-3-phosphoglycerate phosphatase